MIYAKKRECFRQKDLILLLSLLLNFIRVLDLAKTAPQEAVTDEVSLLLAIKVHNGKRLQEIQTALDRAPGL